MKIGVVSEQTGLGIHTIRYYEKQGLIQAPEKDGSGHRTYSNQDLDLLNWISCMKHSGMSLNKIKQYTLAFYKNDTETCVTFLQEHLKRLYKQKHDIDHYISVTQNKLVKLKSIRSQ